MNFQFTLITNSAYINLPEGILGWLAWFVMALIIALCLYYLRSASWGELQRSSYRAGATGQGKKNSILLFLILLVITPITSLFLGIHLDARAGAPLPGLPVEMTGVNIMVLSAVPWMLAGGWLGPLPAAILGLLAGTIQALWGTHSPFTPLESMLLAVLFSAAINQRYRTRIYGWLRQPFYAALLLALIYPIIYMATAPYTVQSSLASQLDYAFSNVPNAWLVMGTELLIAGLTVQFIRNLRPARWGSQAPLEPSPAERSLQVRLLSSMVPLGILMILTMFIGSWLLAGKVARDILESQMRTTTQIVANQAPYFMQNGQNLVTKLSSDPRLAGARPDQLTELLSEMIKSEPFFSQLVILDDQGQTISAYPDSQFTGQQISLDEQVGIQLALNGLPFQSFTLPPRKDSTAAQVSFMSGVADEDHAIHRIILARTDLANNPMSRPLITGLNGMEEFNAEGMLIDQNGRILIHPDPNMLMTSYPGSTDSPQSFYQENSSDGTRNFVYFQPISGVPWTAIVTVPIHAAQQLALRVLIPLLGMVLVLSCLAVIVLSLGLRVVTSSLTNLAAEADNMSKGSLDKPLLVEGEDEIAQVRAAFEKMRVSVKERLDELNRLLAVSQGVATNLDMVDAVQPVLNSAVAMGASLARVILSPSVVPELDGSAPEPTCYSAGLSKDLYCDLDEQILTLTRQQDRLILNNLTRPRLLTLTPGLPYPDSLAAFSLRHESQTYGVMWAAYDQSHTFTEEELNYLTTIAGQAAIAAANTRLFLNAEIGRKRLEAILNSSPEPILVTDQHNRLILSNPAAWQLFGMGFEPEAGQPIEKIIHHKELLDLLLTTTSDMHSAEVDLQKGLIYQASVYTVAAEGQRVGQVCILLDVTRFKELDALKSEFVSTVSHDLRTPLALMRGYATMLEMVGQLNEQQTNYARKIVAGVESMTRMVNNLLDLRRIETGLGLQPEAISPDEIVHQVVNELEIQATQKKIQIKTEIPAQGVGSTLEADPALLKQALHNLLENAIKYTRNEGKITLRVQPQAERIIFEVSDNGIGISPMDQPRLFEKFYRFQQPGTQENQGSGLGLAIVRSICERHHGQVWVESQLGKGSTFYMAIPFKQPPGPKTPRV